jgi:hypothetical protein
LVRTGNNTVSNSWIWLREAIKSRIRKWFYTNNTRRIYFDMGLEDAGPRGNETHGENGVVEAVKVRQVAPILVLPHVDVAVNRQPGTGHLGKRIPVHIEGHTLRCDKLC